MKRSELVFQIKVWTERLRRAYETDNFDLAWRVSRFLYGRLYPDLFNSIQVELAEEPKQLYYLVFSDAHPDGVLLSKVEYRRLCLSMSPDDLNTHTAVEVAKDMVDATEQTIMLASSQVRKRA